MKKTKIFIKNVTKESEKLKWIKNSKNKLMCNVAKTIKLKWNIY